MRQSILLIFIFLFKTSLAQYKVDSTIKVEYLKMAERLPDKIKKFIGTEFRNGLGVLTSLKTDTLNKNELEPIDTSLKIYNINNETGKEEPLITSPNEEESINETYPMWLSCGCRFKGDTLEVVSGISLFSGFFVIIKLNNDKAKAIYSEDESEGKVFETKLTNKKVSEITIPATINDLIIDRYPKKNITEIFGKMSVTTNGFYSYVNAWSFKNEYIYKRMKIQFYFRCTAKKRVQQ